MPRTKEEREAFQRQAMGCTSEELNAINDINPDDAADNLMFAAGILSDAQELLAMDLQVNAGQVVSAETAERVRQHLNRAKHYIFNVQSQVRAAERAGVVLPTLEEVERITRS